MAVAGIAEEEGGQAVVRRQVEDVGGWLLRHGIVARVQVPERYGSAVEQLDRIAADTGAGVVIAVVYGRSRFANGCWAALPSIRLAKQSGAHRCHDEFL